MGYERKERLTRNITLMLTMGIFSIVPVAEGAPVLDHIETAGTHVQQSGTVTDVTSEIKNNVVNWKDFSVEHGETVRFDHGVTGETARRNGQGRKSLPFDDNAGSAPKGRICQGWFFAISWYVCICGWRCCQHGQD